jgi:hypothetical protein
VFHTSISSVTGDSFVDDTSKAMGNALIDFKQSQSHWLSRRQTTTIHNNAGWHW